MRRLILGLLALTFLPGIQGPARVYAQSADLGQLLQAALSPDDLPDFYINADTSTRDASNQAAYDAALFREMFADDLPNVGPAYLTVDLLAFRAGIPLSDIRAPFTSELFANMADAVDVQVTGSLGIGDLDIAATWLQWDATENLYYRYYRDDFLQGRLVGVVVVATHADVANPSLIAQYAQQQDAKLLAPMLLPIALVTTTTSAPPVPIAPAYVPGRIPAPPAAVAPPPTMTCPNGFIPSPGNGRGPTLCRDGLCSHSAGSGTCSGHGGIAIRIGHSDIPLAA